MATYLNFATKRIAVVGVLVGVLGGMHAGAVAQALVDPTRPPSIGTGQAADANTTSAGPVLQSILISQRRAEAIVNGRTVRVGDKVGEAKVVRITETEVQLRNGKELQTLKLYPNIEKQSNFGRIGTKAINR